MSPEARLAHASAPHVHQARSVPALMGNVVAALVPGVVTYVWLYGCGVLVQMLVAVPTAIALEWAALRWRGINPRPFVADGSAAVMACLLVLAIPPYAPWWTTVCAVMVAALIGKHAYGGLGSNIFNPAMVGYVFVLLCFPVELSRWPNAAQISGYLGPLDSVRLILCLDPARVDAISGATVLDYSRTQTALMHMQSEMRSDRVYGVLGGRGWEWINAAFLAGGLWLCQRRVIPWQIPAAVIGALVLIAGLCVAIDAELYAGPMFHLFAGATMLGAFFIATDPVSAATTPNGMLVYGAGIGVLIYLLRFWTHYPDAVAFAVLCMNAVVPLIDRCTPPRLYGH